MLHGEEQETETRASAAIHAFVDAIGVLGNYYHDLYSLGHRDSVAELDIEEDNLLYAWRLARAGGWWQRVIHTMQGLHVLYQHEGRRTEWMRLVNEAISDFVEPETDKPLAHREAEWSIITDYRILLAMETRDLAKAERLSQLCVKHDRQRVPSVLQPPAEILEEERQAIRGLALSLARLGDIQREQEKPDCISAYQESMSLYQKLGERSGEAIRAFNLGHAYKNIPALRNLIQAEKWYKKSLELHGQDNPLARAQCLGQLGLVACESFLASSESGRPESELLDHLNDASQYLHLALDLLPSDALYDQAGTHNSLGTVDFYGNEPASALAHWREAIQCFEAVDAFYDAAGVRSNVATTLLNIGRLDDALPYAQAALRRYSTFGDRAAAEIQRTQRLIAKIEQAMKERSGLPSANGC